MKNFFRLLAILHIVGKYRLDQLFDRSLKSKKAKFALMLFSLYPKRSQQRGYRLRMAFEELGPIFVKFGQLLSTRPDLIPPDIILELDQLQDNVTPFASDSFKAIVETSLGQAVETCFSQYQNQPLASASVAQVHAATLHDGRECVIKVVRPGIEHIIAKDIALLLFMASSVESLFPHTQRLKPVEVVLDYKNTIFDELDLKKEAANASQLRRNFENSNQLYVPEVYWEYCSEKVLVIERIYGTPISDIDTLREHDTDLKKLAETGVDIFFKQVFEHNFFHADMHPGNIFVDLHTPRNPSYIAVDMAIIGSLTREDQYYLARNLLAMFRRDYRQVAELHVLSGWVPKHTSISGFESAIRSVCEPIFDRPLQDISFGETLINLFKTAQRFEMPVQPQLVLLQKTLLNIEGLGRQLYPELDLWDTAHPYLEKWMRDRFHPKALWKELKHHSPEWIERFPEVPQLIFDTSNQLKLYLERNNAFNEELSTRHKKPRYSKQIKLAILLLLSAGIALTWRDFGAISSGASLAFGIALGLLVLS